MKKTIFTLCCILLIINPGCKNKEYPDLADAIIDITIIQEKYLNKALKISSKNDFITVLNEYSVEIYLSILKLDAAFMNYPELNDHKNIPNDLKLLIDIFNEAKRQLTKAAEPLVSKYGKDPAVKKALTEALEKEKDLYKY
jgi:hypothetical protein